MESIDIYLQRKSNNEQFHVHVNSKKYLDEILDQMNLTDCKQIKESEFDMEDLIVIGIDMCGQEIGYISHKESMLK